YIRVLERRGPMKKKEPPGAEEIYRSFAGKDSGIPLLVFLDTHGELIVSTRIEPSGDNIGYPVDGPELDWLEEMFERIAPNATPEQRAAEIKACKKVAAKWGFT